MPVEAATAAAQSQIRNQVFDKMCPQTIQSLRQGLPAPAESESLENSDKKPVRLVKSVSSYTDNKLEQVVIQKAKGGSSTRFMWSGFYQKAIKERLKQIEKINPDLQVDHYLKDGGLTIEQADLMIENCIGKVSIPLGLGLNFVINKTEYIVPMAIEEPSVIAAASSAAKFISENSNEGGFIASSMRPVMIGQIQLLSSNYVKVQDEITKNKQALINYGNEACPNMIKRQSGVIDVQVREVAREHKDGSCQ